MASEARRLHVRPPARRESRRVSPAAVPAVEIGTVPFAWTAFWFWIGLDPGLSVLMRRGLILHDILSIGVISLLAGWVVLGNARLTAFGAGGVGALVVAINAVNIVSVLVSPVTFASPARIYGPLVSWIAASVLVTTLVRGRAGGELLTRMGAAFVTGTIVTVLSPIAVYHLDFLAVRYGLSVLDPNTVGFRAVVALMFVLGGGVARRVDRLRAWLAALFVTMLILSFSKTAIVGAAAGLLALWMFSGRRVSLGKRWYLQLIAVAIPVAIFWSRLVAEYTAYIGNAQEFDTLSGRTVLWQLVLDLSSAHPWLGYGFQTFRDVIAPYSSIWGNSLIVHAHNAYLTALLQTGYLGTGLFVLMVVTMIWQFVRLACRPRLPHVALWMALVLILLIRSWTEGTFAASTPEFAMLAALAMIGGRLLSDEPQPDAARSPGVRRMPSRPGAPRERWAG